VQISEDYIKEATAAIERGLGSLKKAQKEPGDWGDPGISALVINTFFLSLPKVTKSTHPFLWKGLEKLAALQKPDGSIFLHGNATYVTSVCVMSFVYSRDTRFEETLKRAMDFLLASQVFDSQSKFDGGFGYEDRKKKPGGPYSDIVNTEYALEALHLGGIPADNPVWARSIAFLTRCQHVSEKNPASWVDASGRYTGGFVYYPGESKAGKYTLPDGKTVLLPYGSVTYAGIKSMIYAHLTKKDPRVAAALEWIKRNWTLENNPGFDVTKDRHLGKQGIFYYFVTFAKTMHALGRDTVTDARGATHDWRRELVGRIVPLQKEGGAWKNEWKSIWWEAMEPLATSYAVQALSYCLRK
jgi:squalene-hopene/tetraprenyl-beta-curcumene cyclase